MTTEIQRVNAETDATARGAVETLHGVVARLTEAQRLCSSTAEADR